MVNRKLKFDWSSGNLEGVLLSKEILCVTCHFESTFVATIRLMEEKKNNLILSSMKIYYCKHFLMSSILNKTKLDSSQCFYTQQSQRLDVFVKQFNLLLI